MKTLEIMLLAIVAVFAPIQAAVISVFVLVLADLLTGILAARKRGEKITSTGIKRTVGKLFLYEAALCIGFITQQYLTGDIIPVTKLISSVIGLTELKSCVENIDAISGSSMFKSLISLIVASQKDSNEKEEK